MDKSEKALRFNAATKSVVIETVGEDGARREVEVGVDIAEAIYSLFLTANVALPLTEPDGFHVVTGFKGEPHDQAFHLVLQTTTGQQAIFAFAAPGKNQDQVATVSEAIRDAMMRLLPRAN